MKYIDNDRIVYQLDSGAEPAAVVASGETVRIRTHDCFHGQLLPPGTTLDEIDFGHLNPATGPLFIEGARPGDTLKIEILDIELDSLGCTEVDQTFGVLRDRVDSPAIRRAEVSGGGIGFSGRLSLRLRPMIGVIGVAPAGAPVATDTPGNHGGNMDCTMITKGAVLYLPVSAPGALLALGDLHACMGDGEIGGCGLEIPGRVTVRVTALPVRPHPFPVVIRDGVLAAIASEPTVEEAWQAAVRHLHDLLLRDTELAAPDAIMLQSLAADLVICQTVNPRKTVRMAFPLDYAEAYGYAAP